MYRSSIGPKLLWPSRHNFVLALYTPRPSLLMTTVWGADSPLALPYVITLGHDVIRRGRIGDNHLREMYAPTIKAGRLPGIRSPSHHV